MSSFEPNARRTIWRTILRLKHKVPFFHNKCPIFDTKTAETYLYTWYLGIKVLQKDYLPKLFLHSHHKWEDISLMWKMTFEIFIKSLRVTNSLNTAWLKLCCHILSSHLLTRSLQSGRYHGTCISSGSFVSYDEIRTVNKFIFVTIR